MIAWSLLYLISIGLGTKQSQAITWTKDELVHWVINASLGSNKLSKGKLPR